MTRWALLGSVVLLFVVFEPAIACTPPPYLNGLGDVERIVYEWHPDASAAGKPFHLYFVDRDRDFDSLPCCQIRPDAVLVKFLYFVPTFRFSAQYALLVEDADFDGLLDRIYYARDDNALEFHLCTAVPPVGVLDLNRVLALVVGTLNGQAVSGF